MREDWLVSKKPDTANRLKCSFCGKSDNQVKKLIAGPGVYICDECVDLCNEIISEELFESAPRKKPPPVNDLKQARRDILQTALRSEFWIIQRVANPSTGIAILVDGQPLGTTMEVKSRYVAAFEDLVRDDRLSHCGDDTYQINWRGFLESKASSVPTHPDAEVQLEIEALAKRLCDIQSTSSESKEGESNPSDL
jgi:hypothetical protein